MSHPEVKVRFYRNWFGVIFEWLTKLNVNSAQSCDVRDLKVDTIAGVTQMRRNLTYDMTCQTISQDLSGYRSTGLYHHGYHCDEIIEPCEGNLRVIGSLSAQSLNWTNCWTNNWDAITPPWRHCVVQIRQSVIFTRSFSVFGPHYKERSTIKCSSWQGFYNMDSDWLMAIPPANQKPGLKIRVQSAWGPNQQRLFLCELAFAGRTLLESIF